MPYLPPCEIPHRLKHDHPSTFGGMTFSSETEHHRFAIQDSMEQALTVLDEARDEFEKIFGRRPAGALETFDTEDADTIVIACNTMARTLHTVVTERRAKGEKIGMIRTKLVPAVPTQGTAGSDRQCQKSGGSRPQSLTGVRWDLLAGNCCNAQRTSRCPVAGLPCRPGWW